MSEATSRHLYQIFFSVDKPGETSAVVIAGTSMKVVTDNSIAIYDGDDVIAFFPVGRHAGATLRSAIASYNYLNLRPGYSEQD